MQQTLPHLSPVLLQVLYNRGLTGPGQIQAFLEGHYTESTDPFRLPDMEKAVERVKQALENDETVIIYGDFDADGVTSTVLLVEALRKLGFARRQAQPYIPDRIDEGYGLNKDALTFLREERNADLVITVDCGVRAVAEVEHANDMGLDIIITDHHSIGKQLPPALAVINPKREESSYPERMLAGVGIAFKLAQALRQALPNPNGFEEENLLDLVALGTVADLAPLLGENRQLVLHGLRVLNRGQRPGVAALSNVAGLKMGQLTAESIAFGLGPRINAAGRLDHAYSAAKLLAVNNLLQAQPLAQALNSLNKRRQQLTRSLSAHAETLIEPDTPLLFVADADFVPGVVGLVASRLAENYYRPAVVIEHGETESRGSCRSIPEFHITRALDEVADLLDHYGGHSQAAGLTVRNERLPELQARLTEIAAAELEGRDLRPTLEIDVDLPLRDIDWALNDLLQQLEPTGMANPTPIFMSRDVQVFNFRTVGSDGSHLQLDLSDGERGIKGIAFRQGEWAGQLPRRIDIAYTVNVNEWRGRRSLQLIVQDIRPSHPGESTS